MTKIDDDRVRVTLSHPHDDNVTELEYETARRILHRVVVKKDGTKTSEVAFDEFVEVAGSWWPRRIRNTDADGRQTFEQTIDVTAITDRELTDGIGATLADRDDILLVGKLPELEEARDAVSAGRTSFENKWIAFLALAREQRWDDAQSLIDRLLLPLQGKRVRNRIALGIDLARRHLEEARERALRMTRQMANEAQANRPGLVFAANQLMQVATQISTEERLALLDQLRSVFTKDSAWPRLQSWYYHRLRLLQALGRTEEALAVLDEVIQRAPLEITYHTQRANTRAVDGYIDESIADLRRLAASRDDWSKNERRAIFDGMLKIAFGHHRFEIAIELIDTWQQTQPGVISGYDMNRYLSLILTLGQVDRRESLIDTWFKAGLADDADSLALARLDGAIAHALGRGWNVQRHRFDVDQAPRLLDAVRAMWSHKDHDHRVRQILFDQRFAETPVAKKLRHGLRSTFEKKLATLSLREAARQLQVLLYSPSGRTHAGGWDREKVLDRFIDRWVAERTPFDDELVRSTLGHQASVTLRIRFERHALSVAKDEEAVIAARTRLHSYLQTGSWSTELERELLDLACAFQTIPSWIPKAAERNREARVTTVHRTIDTIEELRRHAEEKKIENSNALSRRELAKAKAAKKEIVRRAMVDVVRGLETRLSDDAALQSWMTAERLERELLTDTRKASELRDEARQVFDSVVAAAPADRDPTPLESSVAHRTLGVLTWITLATDEKVAVDELLARLTEIPESSRDFVDAAKVHIELLIVVDRADAAEAFARTRWENPEADRRATWGRFLAYLVAERGDLEGAVDVMRGIAKITPLANDDFRALERWLTALGQKDAVMEARRDAWETWPEWDIAGEINRLGAGVHRRGNDVPTELDPEIPEAFIVLFRKAQNPGYHIRSLQTLYRTTRDFRLLAAVARAHVGQSRQGVYNLLGSMKSILGLVEDEATLDKIDAEIAAVRATTKRATDLRAMNLLEALANMRALELRHGVEDRRRGVVLALQRAERGDWADGERGQYAEWLGSLGQINDEAILDTVLEQLGRLLKDLPRRSSERFTVASKRAWSLHHHRRVDAAILALEGAFADNRRKDGSLASYTQWWRQQYREWLTDRGRHRDAERFFLAELKLPYSATHLDWLEIQLYTLYEHALDPRKRVSLDAGSGLELYKAVHDRMIARLETSRPPQHLAQVIYHLTQIQGSMVGSATGPARVVRQDILDFAFRRLPALLRRLHYRNSQNMIDRVAWRVTESIDAVTGVEFLVNQAENDPPHLVEMGQDFWVRHAPRLGDSMHRAGFRFSTSLDSRLLRIVLDELREDLTSGRSRNRAIYDGSYHKFFWGAKRADFRRIALEVAREKRDDEARLRYVTDYLYGNLEEVDDAIALLVDYHRRRGLGIDNVMTLCDWLTERKRHGEALALVRKAVADHGSRLDVHVRLMKTLHALGRRGELRDALVAAEKTLLEDRTNKESTIAALAQTTVETELPEDGVRLYREAINLRTRGSSAARGPDGTLATYYRYLSNGLSGLHRTKEAVDAAGAAIVAWGSSRKQRQKEIGNLDRILIEAKDLDGWTTMFEAEVTSFGLENPILRRALGRVLMRKNRPLDAAGHLRRAMDVEPDNLDLHRLLVQALDAAGRSDEAEVAQIAFARASGRKLAPWQSVFDRRVELGRAAAAERAATELVEMMPLESEGHAALAEIREQAERWEDAAFQWQEVASIRSKEPTGFLRRAKALIRAGKADVAREVIRHLKSTNWPDRFEDVEKQVRKLEDALNR